MGQYKDLDRKVITLARQVVKMCTKAGSGHPSSLAVDPAPGDGADVPAMRYDPKNPWNAGADRLVLSEGHAVPAVYAAYCDLGGVVGAPDKPWNLKFDDALSLREQNSVLDGHPNPAAGFPFFDAATGSLGQGLSVAAGLACAARMNKSDKNIFCIIGDGESREGQIAEALDFIVDHKLTTVVPDIQLQQDRPERLRQSAAVLRRDGAKARRLRLRVRVIDGHDFEQIFAALSAAPSDKPIAIVANTVKGWGVDGTGKTQLHGKPLKESQIAQAMAGPGGQGNGAWAWRPSPTPPTAHLKKPAPPCKAPSSTCNPRGSFPTRSGRVGLEKDWTAQKLSTRKAYGMALAALGVGQPRHGLDGDVKNSSFAEYSPRNIPTAIWRPASPSRT